MNLLFVCTNELMRSPTAADVARRMGHEARSAGVASSARHQIERDDLAWADRIFVMEHEHRQALLERFSDQLSGREVTVLGIPDRYRAMDPELIQLLERRLPEHLGSSSGR